jgi:hypothetical protein
MLMLLIGKMHGGSLSLAIGDRRPIIEVGQDESVYQQYTYSALGWKEKHKSQIRPKGDRDAVMLSVFFGPSIGFGGLDMEEPIGALERINAIRKSNAMVKFVDQESAQEVFNVEGTVSKESFGSWQDVQDTLCLTFDHGKNRDGYWNNARMAVQTEDVGDILRGLFLQHDLEIHFDNSSGHTKKHKEGLNVNVMNSGWGGKAPWMRPSNLTNGSVIEEQRHPHQLGATMTQRFNFDNPDEQEKGPKVLSEEERQAQKYDRPTGELKKKEKTAAMLRAELKISPANRSRFRKAELVALAKEAGIETEHEKPVIIEGWYSKPKGILQVLWERGFIDDTQLYKYRKTVPNSWKNEDGSIKDN